MEAHRVQMPRAPEVVQAALGVAQAPNPIQVPGLAQVPAEPLLVEAVENVPLGPILQTPDETKLEVILKVII